MGDSLADEPEAGDSQEGETVVPDEPPTKND